MAENTNFDKYPAQELFPTYSSYGADNFFGLRGEALAPALYLGDHNSTYLAANYTGISNVDAKLYSNRVSPLKGWLGQSPPTNLAGQPTDGNPDINWIMDFSTSELYTYGDVITPGTMHTRDPAWPVYCTAAWIEQMLAKNFIYEGAPVKGQLFRDQHENVLELATEEEDRLALGGSKRENVLQGYPDYDREFTRWGRDEVGGGEHTEIDNDRPVRGWPLRIQRIPLCVDPAGVLQPLDGSKSKSDDPCAGGGGEVKGYFYTLATDPVLFPTDDPCDERYWNGEVHQWISKDGLIPLSTSCGGGGGSFGVSGYDCTGGETSGCYPVECLNFESGDFCVVTGASGECGGTANLYWAGFPISGPTGCSGEGSVDVSGVKDIRLGSGLYISDYESGDCCDAGYVEISAPTLNLSISGGEDCCFCPGEDWIDDPSSNEHAYEKGDYVVFEGKCWKAKKYAPSCNPFGVWSKGCEPDTRPGHEGGEYWEQVGSYVNKEIEANVTNITVGKGLTAVSNTDGEIGECEGGSVVISACVPTISGSGCYGSGVMDLGNLNIGSGLCLDINYKNCEATLYSPNSIPLTVQGGESCCGEVDLYPECVPGKSYDFGDRVRDGGRSYECMTWTHSCPSEYPADWLEIEEPPTPDAQAFTNVSNIILGSGLRVVGGSDGSGGDCCIGGSGGDVIIEACPITISGSGCDGEFVQELANLRVGSGLCLEQIDECTTEITVSNPCLTVSGSGECCVPSNIEPWEEGKKYDIGDEVEEGGKCYQAVTWTDSSPTEYPPDWREIDCNNSPEGTQFDCVQNLIFGSG